MRFSLFRLFFKNVKKPDPISETDSSTMDDLDPVQREMIRGVLDLASMNVRDIMIPRIDIIGIPVDSTFKKVIPFALKEGHSRIPVYDGTIDNIVGILYAKDLLRYIIEKPKNFELAKNIHKPLFIPETMPLDELLVEFRKRRVHMAIAVDEYGGVSGLMTLENILEEIVGEINDEYDDPEKARIIKKGKNEFEIDARMSINELNARLSVELPSGSFETLGGLVLDSFGRIPEKGDESEVGRFSFRIKDIRGTRIQRVILTISRNAS
jgi:magnesium and cobalt transporter